MLTCIILHESFSMNTYQLFVENIRCKGCMDKIKSSLLALHGVIAVNIIAAEHKVCVSGIAIERDELVHELENIGYPEIGKNNIVSRAKSFITCQLKKLG